MAKKTKKKSPKNPSSSTKAASVADAKGNKAAAKPTKSPAFVQLQAAYDAGNYALTRKLAVSPDLTDDERADAQRLMDLTQVDPVILGLGVGVVLLVLVVAGTLLTHA